MPRLIKIAYFITMIILGLLVAFVLLHPMARSAQYSEVRRESVLKSEDGWYIQFDILNREGEDTTYRIIALVDSEPSEHTVFVRDGKGFTYIKQIIPSMLTAGEVKITVYKEGDAVPLGEATYYLK